MKKSIPPSIQWMNENHPVGHVFWPVFALSLSLAVYCVVRAFMAYGATPAINHPLAFLFSLAVVLLLPPAMAVGHYIFWRLWRPRADELHEQAKKEGDAENDQPAMGYTALFCLIAALGFIPLLLFIGLLALLDVAGLDVKDDTTRNVLVAGLMVAALGAERWLRVGVNIMIGGVLLWGGIYVYWHMADDTLSRWILSDSGLLY